MKTPTLPLRNSINRARCWLALLLIPLALACFALPPQAGAVVPAPDGGYPSQNTAEGEDALFSLDTSLGTDNTGIGFHALLNSVAGSRNTAVGSGALSSSGTAFENTAVGANALSENTSGGQNTAVGFSALANNTLGTWNTAVGWLALLNNTSSQNTAVGFTAMQNNTTGDLNTATGAWALYMNTTGRSNTATGWRTLFINTTGSDNTATGIEALLSNTTGNSNTATGTLALENNSTGHSNSAHGQGALKSNTTASFNTASGARALFQNTVGENNTASGARALLENTTGENNTAAGVNALVNNTTGSNNIGVGFAAGSNLTTGDNNIAIGSAGVPRDSATIRIGDPAVHQSTYVAGISGVMVADGVAVVVGADGHFGTVTSSARYKENIRPMDKTSEAILALKPVTFRYKHELDPDGIPQFGLVAEEVEKVNPALVARDEHGKPCTVRYDAVNAMLLNEFLKEHKAFLEEQRKVQEQGATIARLEQQIEALTAGLQKVSAQLATGRVRVAAATGLELSRPAPQTVRN